jgi:DNA-binding CsgD family transcriptional regulator
VAFRHPLVRSAIYKWAPHGDRRKVHEALATVTDPELDPDRRAWHRAQAAPTADEEVAVDLERSAERAQARGGLAAASVLLDQAARLTSDPTRRAERALAAAQTKYEAGALDASLALLATLDAGPLNDSQRARIDLLRAKITYGSERSSDAPPLLLEAARALEAIDVDVARETYLYALSSAMFAGHLAVGVGPVEVSEAARAAPRPQRPAGPSDLLLDGLAARFTDGYATAAPMLKEAFNAFRTRRQLPPQEARWLWVACWAACDLWDDESWTVLSARQLQLARETGALNDVLLALSTRIYFDALSGELDAAASLFHEMETVADATGGRSFIQLELWIATLRGREGDAIELFEATTSDGLARGDGVAIMAAEAMRATLSNSLGRYEAALDFARRATSHVVEDLSSGMEGLTELIEAAVRCGDVELAARTLDHLSAMARASGTEWVSGLEARSRALLAEGDTAETLYREAIDRLGRTRIRVDLARAHLLFGEWLRRQRRRADAREQLRTAHELFTAMGMTAFAERAARELLATGEKARARKVETQRDLTPQEDQIARLARDGLSNPEIGGRLYISARTVEYHLRKVFTKLDISSRQELQAVLEGESRG